MLIVAKKNFTYNNEENFFGICLMPGQPGDFFTLEAQKRGLVTHAMGGFDMDKARSSFNIS